MTVHSGPTPPLPPPPRDLSFSQATEDAQRDFARLLHAHSPTWSLDLSGAVEWRCECSPDVPRNAQALDKHVIYEVRKARGPVRPPKR